MPALTAEQKAEIKAAKKLEKQRQEELRKRQLRHDALSREIKFAQINIREHEKKWKKMLIDIALPRMKADLEYQWHNFEKIIDLKDFQISFLLDELNDGEEQYLMNFRNHSEHIDGLIVKLSDNMNDYKKDFENNLKKMKLDAEKEVESICKKSFESEEYYKTMLFGLEVAKKEQEKLVRGDYLSKIDEETGKYNNIIQYLRATLERNYSDLWDTTVDFLNDYYESTANRSKVYVKLAAQDDFINKICSEQTIKLSSMQKYLKRLRDRFAQVKKVQDSKISDLESEQQFFSNAFLTLRARLTEDKEIDNYQLMLLSAESNSTREHLSEIVAKGKRVLKLAAICRKLETQSEKILPFPKESHQIAINLTFYQNNMRIMSNLEAFWRRVAQADAIRHSIYEEREYLKKKNFLLRQKIHNYCECVECPPSETETSKTRSSCIPITDCYLMQKNYKHFK